MKKILLLLILSVVFCTGAYAANTPVGSLTGSASLSATSIIPFSQAGTTYGANAFNVANLTTGVYNRIINGNFVVNQRNYAQSTTTASGVYMVDRWKSLAANSYLAFTANQYDVPVTVTGTVEQVVEGCFNEGGTFVLSWVGTAQGRINGQSYTASPQTITGVTAGTNITVDFGAGTLSDVQLEAGSIPTKFQRRPVTNEILACQRYFVQFGAPGSGVAYPCVGLGMICNTNTNAIVYCPMPSTLRVNNPTLTYSGSFNINDSSGGHVNGVASMSWNGTNQVCAIYLSLSFISTIGRPVSMQGEITPTGYVNISAEL